MKRLLLGATMLGALGFGGAAHASLVVNEAGWAAAGCVGASYCVVNGVTISASGNRAAATGAGLTVFQDPATLSSQTFNGGTGLGVNFAHYPRTTGTTGPNREIQFSETMTFTFPELTRINSLAIIFLYAENRFANDPPQELAFITGDGTTYTLSLSNSLNPAAPGAFTWNGLGTVTAETPFNRGVFRFDNPFGGRAISVLTLTTPFQANDNIVDNSDYSFLRLTGTPVPEPATLALLGAGLLGLAFAARRRRAA